MSTDGIFNINKPGGMTSFDVVAIVRRLTKEKKVGHAGTLDPSATGVLPVCIGQATKVIEYLTGTTKSYCATITLGRTTDTYDAEGRVLSTHPVEHITCDQVEKALDLFRGKIDQTPPMYSAIKISGRKLYELARVGIEVERPPRQIEIFNLKLLDWNPPSFTITVDCSKGTYIRSLAYDIGQVLGCGGYLEFLVRTRTGPFAINEAISVDQLRMAFELSFWHTQLYSPDEVLLDWPAAIVSAEKERAIKQGRNIILGNENEPEQTPNARDQLALSAGKCRAYSSEGTLVALLSFDRQQMHWHPDKVFFSTAVD